MCIRTCEYLAKDFDRNVMCSQVCHHLENELKKSTSTLVPVVYWIFFVSVASTPCIIQIFSKCSKCYGLEKPRTSKPMFSINFLSKMILGISMSTIFINPIGQTNAHIYIACATIAFDRLFPFLPLFR